MENDMADGRLASIEVGLGLMGTGPDDPNSTGVMEVRLHTDGTTYTRTCTADEGRAMARAFSEAAEATDLFPAVHAELLAMGLSGQSASEFMTRLAQRVSVVVQLGPPVQRRPGVSPN